MLNILADIILRGSHIVATIRGYRDQWRQITGEADARTLTQQRLDFNADMTAFEAAASAQEKRALPHYESRNFAAARHCYERALDCIEQQGILRIVSEQALLNQAILQTEALLAVEEGRWFSDSNCAVLRVQIAQLRNELRETTTRLRIVKFMRLLDTYYLALCDVGLRRYVHTLSTLETALEYSHECQEDGEQVKILNVRAWVYSELAMCESQQLRKRENLIKAQEDHTESLDVCQNQSLISARLHFIQGHYAVAWNFVQQYCKEQRIASLVNLQEEDNASLLILCGRIQLGLKKYKTALPIFQQALQVLPKVKETNDRGIREERERLWLLCATAYQALKDQPHRRDCLREACCLNEHNRTALQSLAEFGDRQAHVYLGLSYLKDFLKISENNPDAPLTINQQDKQNISQGLDHLKKAGDHVLALHSLGVMLDLSSTSQPKSSPRFKSHSSQARYFLQRGVDQKHPAAMVHMAKIYLAGRGVPKNTAYAEQLLKKARCLGDASAAFYLALQTKDERKKIAYLKEAALQGHLAALESLALLYLKQNNWKEGLIFAKQAAARNSNRGILRCVGLLCLQIDAQKKQCNLKTLRELQTLFTHPNTPSIAKTQRYLAQLQTFETALFEVADTFRQAIPFVKLIPNAALKTERLNEFSAFWENIQNMFASSSRTTQTLEHETKQATAKFGLLESVMEFFGRNNLLPSLRLFCTSFSDTCIKLVKLAENMLEAINSLPAYQSFYLAPLTIERGGFQFETEDFREDLTLEEPSTSDGDVDDGDGDDHSDDDDVDEENAEENEDNRADDVPLSAPSFSRNPLSFVTEEYQVSHTNIDDVFQRRTALLGFTIIPNDGNGHCQFYALADQLAAVGMARPDGSRYTYANLRNVAVQHISEHPALYQPFLDDREHGSSEMAVYIQGMRGHQWGDHLTLLAIARALSINIAIIDDGELATALPWNRIRFIRIEGAENTIYLGHHAEVHYVSLRISAHQQTQQVIQNRTKLQTRLNNAEYDHVTAHTGHLRRVNAAPVPTDHAALFKTAVHHLKKGNLRKRPCPLEEDGSARSHQKQKF